MSNVLRRGFSKNTDLNNLKEEPTIKNYTSLQDMLQEKAGIKCLSKNNVCAVCGKSFYTRQ